MSRFNDIIREDNELLKKTDTADGVITHKLAQISATLAMILDAIQNAEKSDDGR